MTNDDLRLLAPTSVTPAKTDVVRVPCAVGGSRTKRRALPDCGWPPDRDLSGGLFREVAMSFSVVARTGMLCAALVGLSLLPQAVDGQDHRHKEASMTEARIGIPPSIKAEHDEIHAELVAATKASGRVGEAARELAEVLHPHFVREEQIALPPLGLMQALAGGEARKDMLAVLPLTDALRAELPRMLQEHQVIHAATTKLGEVARSEGNLAVAHLAEKLALHARGEEEVFYPAAILVGDVVRARISSSRP